jgi:hypothetical protein
MFMALILAGIGVAQLQEPQTWPWPPPGTDWETVPEHAFARARSEKKPILVYIASAD